MSTRCAIAIKRDPNHYDAIFCHFDGYPNGGVGDTLIQNYTDPDIANALISLGNIESLENSIEETSRTKYGCPFSGSLKDLLKEFWDVEWLYVYHATDYWETIKL